MNELKINSYVPSTELFEVNFGTSNKASNSNSEDKVSFADTLSNALNEVNNKQVIAENSSNALVAGEDVDIADVMLASSEAKISLQLAVEVRNKLLSAYNEIIRMSL